MIFFILKKMENEGILALEALRVLVSLQNVAEMIDENDVQSQRTQWVRPTNARRYEFGASQNLVHEMRLYADEEFFNFTRLTLDQFDELLVLVGPSFTKINTRKDVISPYTRLLITLRYSILKIQKILHIFSICFRFVSCNW